MTFLSNLKDRAMRALPTKTEIFIGSLLWACVMTGSATLSLAWRRDSLDFAILPIAIVFFLGGLLAFSPSLFSARLFKPKTQTIRFALYAAALAIVTVGASMAIFALQYRTYYAQWHGDFPSKLWLIQLIFTLLAACYQFAVSGIRLFLPFSLPILLATAFWFSKRPLRH